ncbi:MAG: hypothetical protein ACYC6Y_00295 [Thermoguttaceae bacterium]
MKRFSLVLGCAVPMMAALLGCGPAGDAGPTRVSASVTVTYKGAPVEGANITLVPKAPDGQAAFGVTDASGKVALSTLGENDGAIPGEYQVLVQKTETKGPDVKVDSTEVGAMPAGEDAMKTGTTTNLLPEKYSSIGTTDLTATVAESGENAFTFELKD